MITRETKCLYDYQVFYLSFFLFKLACVITREFIGLLDYQHQN